MKPRTLPPDYPSDAEFKRRVAETVNALIAMLPAASPPAELPAGAVPVLVYYEPTLGGLIFWSGTEWRWVASAEVVP